MKNHKRRYLSAVKYTLWIFSLFALLLPNLIWGQDADVETLLHQLKTAPADTNRVALLVELAWKTNEDQPQMAKEKLLEAVTLAQKLSFAKGEANAMSGLGTVAEIENELKLALEYHQKALDIRLKLGDKRAVAASYNNLGNVTEALGEYYDALDLQSKNIKILKELKDTARLARAEVNIAGIYVALGVYITANEHLQEARYTFESLGDEASLAKVFNVLGHVWFETEKFDQAISMYDQALELYEKNEDTLGIASTRSNIANAYDGWGEKKERLDTVCMAISYYQDALELYSRIGDSSGIAAVYNNWGTTCKHLKQYDKGLAYLRKSLAIRKRLGRRDGIMETYNSFGDIYFGKKNNKLALTYTNMYYKIALELKDEKFEQKAYKDFSKIYAEMGDFTKAYEYRKRYDEMRYQRLDENRVREFTRRESVYADRKKEDELKRRELEVAQKDAELSRNRATRNGLIGGAVALLLLTTLLYNRSRLRARSNEQLAAKNAVIERARKRADELLMNILPEAAAAELKINNSVKPIRYESVTVMFTDFKGFTKIAELVSPEELIEELDACFRLFDSIVEQYGLEKIKTIGDSYMCAGGLPVKNETHALNTVEAAIAMQRGLKTLMDKKAAEGKHVFEMRVGIHTGPVVAGVVGSHKFAYDIWGDTVNIASWIEQASEPTKINISSSTYELVKHKYPCLQRGLVAAKNKGSIEMYFVEF
jgi:class 3 adenylate cyclase/tetratricopeptide (TPR) repeat protein